MRWLQNLDYLIETQPQYRYWYKGWFLFCPIYAAFEESYDQGGEPMLTARNVLLDPVFTICHYLQVSFNFIAETIDPFYEANWMFMIDDNPVYVSGDDDTITQLN